MIKIRLSGTAEEVREIADQIKQWEALEVSNVSRPYNDRGRTGNVRVYIDAEPATKEGEQCR